MTDTSSSSSGIGFLGLLTILFVALKLTGQVTWSWWLVLFPIYGPLFIFLGVLALIMLVATITYHD